MTGVLSLGQRGLWEKFTEFMDMNEKNYIFILTNIEFEFSIEI